MDFGLHTRECHDGERESAGRQLRAAAAARRVRDARAGTAARDSRRGLGGRHHRAALQRRPEQQPHHGRRPCDEAGRVAPRAQPEPGVVGLFRDDEDPDRQGPAVRCARYGRSDTRWRSSTSGWPSASGLDRTPSAAGCIAHPIRRTCTKITPQTQFFTVVGVAKEVVTADPRNGLHARGHLLLPRRTGAARRHDVHAAPGRAVQHDRERTSSGRSTASIRSCPCSACRRCRSGSIARWWGAARRC